LLTYLIFTGSKRERMCVYVREREEKEKEKEKGDKKKKGKTLLMKQIFEKPLKKKKKNRIL